MARRPGNPSSITKNRLPSAALPWRRPTPTSFTRARAKAASAATPLPATAIYKSVDAGKTWKNVGLRDSRAIGKLIIDPRDPDIVFVAALGHPYGPNQERGIFRTIDGGKTWAKVLFVDENTGGIDVAFDPHNSHILFAAMWQVRRQPWTLSSGGPGSGLYRSGDGGDHLEKARRRRSSGRPLWKNRRGCGR